MANAAEIAFAAGTLVTIEKDATPLTLQAAVHGLHMRDSIIDFMSLYEQLPIVNPTKDKFRHTLLNYTYYELLRIFSNELEKDNSVLFVMGFSFTDDHIREIVLRAANSNPTLLVYVIAYSQSSATAIRERFGDTNIKNANVVFIEPPTEVSGTTSYRFDFSTINRELFGKLFREPALPTPTHGTGVANP